MAYYAQSTPSNNRRDSFPEKLLVGCICHACFVFGLQDLQVTRVLKEALGALGRQDHPGPLELPAALVPLDRRVRVHMLDLMDKYILFVMGAWSLL